MKVILHALKFKTMTLVREWGWGEVRETLTRGGGGVQITLKSTYQIVECSHQQRINRFNDVFPCLFESGFSLPLHAVWGYMKTSILHNMKARLIYLFLYGILVIKITNIGDESKSRIKDTLANSEWFFRSHQL